MTQQADMQKRFNHLTLAILLGFLMVSVSLVFWAIFRAPTLFLREDNPRLVEAELRIQRGTIVDRNGRILAETVGTDNDLARQYPLANMGSPVGYYSFRHGTSGIEDGYDALLRGDSDSLVTEYVRQALHQPQIGQEVQLSLDADLQETAVSLLNNQAGAIILLDNLTGEILLMSSTPYADPNLLDEQFDDLIADKSAPLLNRAVQGQYQPGLILQPFIVAWALENGIIQLDDVVPNPNAEVVVDSHSHAIRCQTPPPNPSRWADVLIHRCPAPMLALAEQLGKSGLEDAFAAFGLTQDPNLPLETETAVSLPVQDVLMGSIGQDAQIITPLQIALAWSSLANNGQAPLPWLVTAVQEKDGRWQPVPPEEGATVTAVSAQTAQLIHNTLQDYAVPVLSGPQGTTNSWFLGSSSATNPRYTAVVVLENNPSYQDAQTIGQTLLNKLPK